MQIRDLVIILLLLISIQRCKSQVKSSDISLQDISFKNGNAELHGIIAIPNREGPFPGVVYVHGAGPEKRHSFYAKYFAKRGIAFLTFDKRSFGESTGKFLPGSNVSYENLELKASDVCAAVRYLKGVSEIDIKRIGLFGFSQAGWVAPLAASFNKDISYLTIVSGGAITTGEEMEYSRITGDNDDFFQNYSNEEILLIESKLQQSGYDPNPIMESIDVKALWLFGDRDESIPVNRTIKNLNTLKEQKGKDYTIKVFKNRNHGLRLPNEKYGPPEYINKMIIDWIKEIGFDSSLFFGQKKSEIFPELFAPNIISTQNEFEFGSVYSKNNHEFFYALEKKSKAEIKYVRFENDKWSEPISILNHEKFSYNDPMLSSDETKLFFISNQTPDKKGKPKDYDIWYIERNGEGWSEPINAGNIINSRYNEYYISFTENGAMYFSSNKNSIKSDTYDYDIYSSLYKNGHFQAPHQLPKEINTVYYEADVFVSSKEDYIIFCSDRPDGMGKGDLYISFKTVEGTWSQSQNMGEKINTIGHELCPFVTNDNKYLFFTRDGNIYWTDFQLHKEGLKTGANNAQKK